MIVLHNNSLKIAASAVLKAHGCRSYARAADDWLCPGDAESARELSLDIAEAAVRAYLRAVNEVGKNNG